MTQYVITLLGKITPELTSQIAAAVGGRVERQADNAADIVVSSKAPEGADIQARFQACALPPEVDFIFQPAGNRRKKLLICDMDSTIITVECIDELADMVGKKAEVSAITERAMNGELDFEAALTERVALLKGLPEIALQDCYDERVRMTPGANELVSAMRKEGAYCVLVSGGFTFFTSRVGMALGFQANYGNVLEVENGKLTGRVTPPILGKESKLATLKAYMEQMYLAPQDVLAIGDGANDLPMLLEAGLGVAYRAKPAVQAKARHKLNHAPLDSLLFALTYV